jgi:hypothetical protein
VTIVVALREPSEECPGLLGHLADKTNQLGSRPYWPLNGLPDNLRHRERTSAALKRFDW